ncbi:hypothetical protein DJ021_14115 [Phenylobacterium hankyongense]|uniref:Uncharacterized protein n=1 Tax=Phenylobacterium hankyongense TaxID=1813876 RepID=A0A328B4S6_9CAUL|nr:hypothetical protein [Phenylobacterium hankyongense]RAK60864.1 hypothetical protein DJ021_14115 [Phenylobacterium hankyongense]
MASKVAEEEPNDHAGRMATFLRAWGIAEMTLDMCIRTIFLKHEMRTPRPPVPVTLERKLAYFMEAHETIPALAPMLDDARQIDARFMREKDLRNTIVHGAPIKYEHDGTVHFLLLRPHKGLPEYQLRTVRPKDWQRLQDNNIHLWLLLFIAVFCLDPPPDIDNPKQTDRERSMQFAARFPGSKRLRRLLQEIVASRP